MEPTPLPPRSVRMSLANRVECIPSPSLPFPLNPTPALYAYTCTLHLQYKHQARTISLA
jgi:hypothetical protein